MRHNSANHLRQLFHYLYDHGITATDNALFVLKDQYRNQNKLPTTYTEKEISKTLAAVDRSSAIGKRDYLIILLAAEYGWRTGDIVNFKFSQIDWDNNTITFEQHKTDIPVEFPLLSSVGNAIIDYLQHGRPKSDAPEIIVSAENGKNGTPLKPSTVHSIVSRYLREADIPHWKLWIGAMNRTLLTTGGLAFPRISIQSAVSMWCPFWMTATNCCFISVRSAGFLLTGL